MLICMRTTMLLPDDLYREVKRAAADDDRTVTSFVEEALREQLRRRGAAIQPRRPYVVKPIGHGGTLPGVDLTSNAALEDLMEGL